jgi:hypothetical protein
VILSTSALRSRERGWGLPARVTSTSISMLALLPPAAPHQPGLTAGACLTFAPASLFVRNSAITPASTWLRGFQFHVSLMTGNLTRGVLLVSKKSFPEEHKVSNADAIVDEATHWAEALLQRSYQGPGDTIEAATYRAEQKYGVPAYTFWSLRYRRPKDIVASVYVALKNAYEAECSRQESRLRHELELTKRIMGDHAASSTVVAQAEASLEAIDAPEEAQ